MRKLSKKRAKENRQYLKLREKFLADNPICQIKVPGICRHEATTVHHSMGRMGLLLIDVRYFKGACLPCHCYVEEHPAEAKEKGWSVSRLSNENC